VDVRADLNAREVPVEQRLSRRLNRIRRVGKEIAGIKIAVTARRTGEEHGSMPTIPFIRPARILRRDGYF
jgi:hypothetical protein